MATPVKNYWCGTYLPSDPLPNGVIITRVQKEREFYQLMRRLHQLSPRGVIEIGTSKGGSLYGFCCAAADEATIITIDLPNGPYGGGVAGGGYPAAAVEVYQSFAQRGQRMLILQGDSHDPGVQRAAKEFLSTYSPDAGIDFLFIDGDHSYEGVRQDFLSYSPLVRPGGLIAFHDIVWHDPQFCHEGPVEVQRFWNEVRQERRYEEIVDDPEQRTCGIGLLYVD